jgi:hypothetical protein
VRGKAVGMHLARKAMRTYSFSKNSSALDATSRWLLHSEESEGVKGVVLLTRYGGDSIKRFRGPPELAQGIAQC